MGVLDNAVEDIEQSLEGVSFDFSKDPNINEINNENVDNSSVTVEDIDAKRVLSETKKELQLLRTTIENQDNDGDQEQAKLFIQSFLDTIKTLEGNDLSLLTSIENTVNTNNYDSKIAIDQLVTIINDLETRFDQLSQTDKEKILDEKKGLQSSTSNLEKLQNDIEDPEKILQDAKKQAISELRDELEKKRWCPKWLSDKIYLFLVAKYIDGEEQKLGKKILGGLMITLLGIAMGKNRKDFFKNIEDLSFENLEGVLGSGAEKFKTTRESIRKRKLFQKTDIEDTMDGLKDNAKEKLEEAKNITQEEIEKGREGLKKYLSKLAQDIGGKVPTKEQLDRVIARIDVKDNTQNIQKMYKFISSRFQEGLDGNIIDGAFEGIGLPFVFFKQMVDALHAEDLISTKEIIFEVGEGVVSYGLKGFKLFGAGMSRVFGKTSWKDLGEQLGGMYDKAPYEAQQVLFALIYKTSHNPIFRSLLNIGEFGGNMINALMFQTGEKIQSLKNISEVYSKNLTTALKDVDDLLTKLPDGDEVVKVLKNSVEQLTTVDDLLKLKVPNNLTGINFEKFIVDAGLEIKKLPIGLQALSQEATIITQKSFQQAIAREIPGIASRANNKLGQLGILKKISRSVVGFTAGEKNKINVIDDLAKYLDEIGYTRKNVAGKGKVLGFISKIKLSQMVVKGPDGAKRLAFQANTIRDVEDLVTDTKYLLKHSPSTLKTLIGKTPLILVGGLAISKDGTPSEKMKNLMKDMAGLIPFVGPIYFIARDGANLNDIKTGQIATGIVLAGMDTYFVVKAVNKGATTAKKLANVGKYFVQPVVDIYELGKLGIVNIQRGSLMMRNIASAVKNKGFVGTLKGLGEVLWKKKPKLALAVALVGLGWYGYDYFFGGDLDDETKAKLAEYEKDPNKLDKEIFEEWPMLEQEEKNDYIKAAVLARGLFQPDNIGDLDIKFDMTSKKYTIVLPEVINVSQKDIVKSVIIDALSQLEPDSSVEMQLSNRAIVNYRSQIDEMYKDTLEPEKTQLKKEYIQAMGYDANAILGA